MFVSVVFLSFCFYIFKLKFQSKQTETNKYAKQLFAAYIVVTQ